jgi:hypothetical protein
MSNNSLSIQVAQRKGREEFDPLLYWGDCCPYMSGLHKHGYQEGWEESKIEYLKKREEDPEQEEFDSISANCPDRYENKCNFKNIDCSKSNCSFWYWRQLK